MKLDEILNKPLPWTVVKDSDAEFDAIFTAGKRKIKFMASNEDAMYDDDRGEWIIAFAEMSKQDGHDELSIQKTGSGNELQVFATVKALIMHLVEFKSATSISFSADKEDGNRAALYAKMVKRSIPDGWKLNQDGDGLAVFFQIVKEALDKPTAYQIQRATPKEFIATFVSNDRLISFSADMIRLDVWEISFDQVTEDEQGRLRRTTKKTGGGKEFEVFATVKSIIETFIRKYQPVEMQIDSHKGESNRGKLYTRMIKNNLPQGWKMEKDDSHPSYETFKLTKV